MTAASAKREILTTRHWSATKGSDPALGWVVRVKRIGRPRSGAASLIGGYAAAFTSSGFASWWRKATARSACAAA
ncbi:hypothetical protein GCM10007973_27810 [Polymorphobacter multimanifer]|nr:hypothetical protein GCM10007973_27810 [Polymorphobacter multimanifer]